jgi:hypothetical protein
MPTVSRWAHGGVEYPLGSSTDNSLLQDADPALFYALQLFESVLNTYVGPRLLAQAAREGFNFPSAVEKVLHVDPTPFLLSDQARFPLFCLYRREESWTDHNASFNKDASIWEWAYVLPPMTPRQIEQLHPIFRSVAVVVSTFAMQSFDPNYEDGATLRELSGIQKMSAGTIQYGNFEKAEGVGGWWKAVTGRLLVVERDEIVREAFDPFEGTNIAIDATDASNDKVVDFIEAETQPAPTIESIAPASGTKSGGTTVIITGTGFLPGREKPRVLIGGAYASSVVVTHSTQLQCLTPEHDAYPTFVGDVQVINPDGQESSVLGEAFTFTTP